MKIGKLSQSAESIFWDVVKFGHALFKMKYKTMLNELEQWEKTQFHLHVQKIPFFFTVTFHFDRMFMLIFTIAKYCKLPLLDESESKFFNLNPSLVFMVIGDMKPSFFRRAVLIKMRFLNFCPNYVAYQHK